MNEDISRLMDGELDDDGAVDRTLAGLRQDGAMATWMCYHVIGDTLRGDLAASTRLSRRLAAALADAIAVGVTPFLLWDAVKILVAASIFPAAWWLVGRRPGDR